MPKDGKGKKRKRPKESFASNNVLELDAENERLAGRLIELEVENLRLREQVQTERRLADLARQDREAEFKRGYDKGKAANPWTSSPHPPIGDGVPTPVGGCHA